MAQFDTDTCEKIMLELIARDKSEKGVLEAFTIVTHVFGVMLFPHNPEWRAELDVITLAEVHSKDFVRRLPHYPMQAASLSPLFFEILMGVNSEEVTARTAKEMGRGMAAGRVLWTIRQMHDAGYEGSVNKAVFLLVKANKATTPEDTSIPISDTGIRDAWQTFKPVAHLWAACRHCEIQGFNPLSDFLTFLAYAEDFRHFGITHTARRQKDLPPTLPPQETWAIPEEVPIPSVNVKMPPLSDKETSILKGYRVPNRKHLDYLDDIARREPGD